MIASDQQYAVYFTILAIALDALHWKQTVGCGLRLTQRQKKHQARRLVQLEKVETSGNRVESTINIHQRNLQFAY